MEKFQGGSHFQIHIADFRFQQGFEHEIEAKYWKHGFPIIRGGVKGRFSKFISFGGATCLLLWDAYGTDPKGLCVCAHMWRPHMWPLKLLRCSPEARTVPELEAPGSDGAGC